jgi:hypothetical protein
MKQIRSRRYTSKLKWQHPSPLPKQMDNTYRPKIEEFLLGVQMLFVPPRNNSSVGSAATLDHLRVWQSLYLNCFLVQYYGDIATLDSKDDTFGKTVRRAAMNIYATTRKPLFLGVFDAYHSTSVIFVFLQMVEVKDKIAFTQLLPIFWRVYGNPFDKLFSHVTRKNAEVVEWDKASKSIVSVVDKPSSAGRRPRRHRILRNDRTMGEEIRVADHLQNTLMRVDNDSIGTIWGQRSRCLAATMQLFNPLRATTQGCQPLNLQTFPVNQQRPPDIGRESLPGESWQLVESSAVHQQGEGEEREERQARKEPDWPTRESRTNDNRRKKNTNNKQNNNKKYNTRAPQSTTQQKLAIQNNQIRTI